MTEIKNRSGILRSLAIGAFVVIAVFLVTSSEVTDKLNSPRPRPAPMLQEGANSPKTPREAKLLDSAQVVPNQLDLRRRADFARAAVDTGRWSQAETELTSLQKLWTKYKAENRKLALGGLLRTDDLDRSIPQAMAAVKARDKARAQDAVGRIRVELDRRS